MDEKRTCPSCGTEIAAGAPLGLCEACLLKVPTETTKRETSDNSQRPTISISQPSTENPGDKISRYKLLRQIGEGGMGTVWEAEQVEPVRRRVAVKVIRFEIFTKEVIARFEAERQALALMNHPNIAKALDAGATETGRPFFVMELVSGDPITEFCDKHKLSTPERLDLFVKVCQAVQHAHQKGIIHRDIKPSNILVTYGDAGPTPKIIDFGIAKATSGQRLTDKTLVTQFEQFIGTPAYISPEQAEMTGVDIDTRSDIYSLGVLLYELLTGTTPFGHKELLQAGLDEMRRIIREVEPPRPSTRLSTLEASQQTTVAMRRRSEAPKLLGEIRGDLDWIVMMSLDKDRDRRYETANGLAKDVKRFLNNEPVIARPPSSIYRMQKFVRRHKAAVRAAAAVTTALILCVVISVRLAFLATEERGRADRQREKAEKAQAEEARLRLQAEAQEAAARQSLYFADMHLALTAWEDSNFGRARDLLQRHRPQKGEKDLRGWEWGYLWRICRSDELATLGQHESRIFSVAFSPDGKMVASGAADGTLKLWDVINRAERTNFIHESAVFGVDFSRQGDHLASASGDGKARVWDLRTLRQAQTFTHQGWVKAAVFSPDGNDLATLSSEGRVHLWDLEAGTQSMTFAVGRLTGGSLMGAMSYSPNGRLLAVANHNKEILIFDVTTGQAVGSPLQPGTHISGMGFSRDSRFLAFGGWQDHFVGICEIARRKLTKTLTGHAGWVCATLFSPSGKTLATAGSDELIRLWDTDSWEEISTLKGHDSELAGMAFSPDGLMLVTGSKDHAVKLWSAIPRQQEIREFKLPSGCPGCWSLSPDHRTLVS